MKIYEILKRENINKTYVNTSDKEIYIVLTDTHSSPALFTVEGRNCGLFSQFEMITLEFEEIKNVTGWERLKYQMYYYVHHDNNVYQSNDTDRYIDGIQYKKCNYFLTKDKAEEVAKEQLLYRKMKKFYDENDGKISWNDRNSKYYIAFDHELKRYDIVQTSSYKMIGMIYFSEEKLARRCIKEIIEPFYVKYKLEPSI